MRFSTLRSEVKGHIVSILNASAPDPGVSVHWLTVQADYMLRHLLRRPAHLCGSCSHYVWSLLVGIKRSLAEEIWDFLITSSPMHVYLFVESKEIQSWGEWPLPEEKLRALSPDALIGYYLLFFKGHGGLMWHTWGLQERSKCFKGKEMLEASSHGLMGWREAKWRWHYKRGWRMTWGKEWGKKLEDEYKVW